MAIVVWLNNGDRILDYDIPLQDYLMLTTSLPSRVDYGNYKEIFDMTKIKIIISEAEWTKIENAIAVW